MDYPLGISIRPNDTVTTGLLWQRPRLWWRTRPDSLYTVIIVDTGIAALQGAQYFHWAVVNIPELDLGAGAEVMEYIPPFQVQSSINESGLQKINVVGSGIRPTTRNADSCLRANWAGRRDGDPTRLYCRHRVQPDR